MEKKQEKRVGLIAGDYYLRVKASHPDNKYRIQGHVLSNFYKQFKLNDVEAKELMSEGCVAWVEIGTESQAKADAKLAADIKKSQTEI